MTLGFAAAVLSSDWAARRTQQEIIRQLETGFDATANVEAVTLSIFPRLSIEGRGLTFTRKREEHRLPFVRIDRFHASGSLPQLLRRSIGLVKIEGFQIDVARGSKPPGEPSNLRSSNLRINEIRANKGSLRVLPDDPEKLPLNFQLEEVTFNDFSFEHAGQYSALLTNPKPEGTIRSSGSFGPWNTFAPRSTPLSGDYEFSDARLNTIKGIGGTLNSTGSFAGVLEHINVSGTTTTPDFQLDLARQPVKLDTRFRAIVDGTSGDTYLEEVDATLGESHIVAKGSVAGTRGAPGRTISLDVTADGRFEDFLRLAVKAPQSPMRGGIALRTAMVLPPGEIDVAQRLQLEGTFKIRRGQFASDAVQDKVDELSRRGRGEPENERVNNVLADFGGKFALRNGRLDLPSFQFAVEGARVALGGNYGLPTQRLDFEGSLLLDAPLSRTTTGFKSLLLKVVDPLFRKQGAGTMLPIVVSGTVDQPSFGLDKGRLIGR
jgi:AsmA-like C-terminal region